MTQPLPPRTILLLIDGLPGGGAERVVVTLAGAFAAAGHHVTIASLSPECAYPIPPGVHYLPVAKHRGIARRARALDAALATAFAGRKIDLAISNLPRTDRIVAASKTLGDAWMCVHCALTASELDTKLGPRRWLKRRQLIRTYSGRRLITVSQALQQDLLAIGIRPQSMTALYNPFDLEQIRTQAKAPCPLDGERFLLHVGRFNAQKRHDRLLDAFALSEFPGKLVLLGEGDPTRVRRQAQALGITDRVVFAGFTPDPYPHMRAAQLLVLSSDYEGFGNVLVEALACGTPVVSTDCPYGPAEILRGELSVGLCALTAEALAEAIKRVLANPPAIRDERLAPFALKQVAARYLALMGSQPQPR